MRILLALMVLNGLSFVVWGCTGLCRYVYENTRDTGRASVVLVAASVAALSAAIWVTVSMELATGVVAVTARILGFEVARPGEMGSWVTYLWLSMSGAVCFYAALRLFRIQRLAFGFAAFTVLHWLTLEALSLDVPALGPFFPALESERVGLLGIAMSASAAAVLLMRDRVSTGAAERPGDDQQPGPRLVPGDVAVVVCAHNEEQVIRKCLEAIARLVPLRNIFVGSDGSTDATVEVARSSGCNVLDIQPNGGKARALEAVLEHFSIRERFQAALILDADAVIDEHYLEHALPCLDDPDVVAVAGHAIPKWYPHWLPSFAMFFAAYRVRLYWLTQAFLRYGQTWKFSNVSFIVPGFASMYRCAVLRHIDVAAAGLSVEDFNMTFEIHRKRLGKIAYTPRARCISQEAHGVVDYTKQVRRWYLGFWQTVRRHGLWPSFFWLSLGVFVAEMLLQSLALLFLPLVATWFLLEAGEPLLMWLPQLGTVELTVVDVVVGVLFADYALTALVAVVERKGVLMLYGLGFVVLRCIDAFLFLYTLPLAFIVRSDGRWVSPERLLAPGQLGQQPKRRIDHV